MHAPGHAVHGLRYDAGWGAWPLQGLHSVRSENLDAGAQPAGGMRRSRTAPRPLPQIEEPLLQADVSGIPRLP